MKRKRNKIKHKELVAWCGAFLIKKYFLLIQLLILKKPCNGHKKERMLYFLGRWHMNSYTVWKEYEIIIIKSRNQMISIRKRRWNKKKKKRIN